LGGGRTSKREKELVAEVARLKAKLGSKNEVIAEISAEVVQRKKSRGALSGRWVPHDTRDAIVDFVRDWSATTEIAAERFVAWIGVARGKFFAWRKRYGKANEHNALVPGDHWLTDVGPKKRRAGEALRRYGCATPALRETSCRESGARREPVSGGGG
jgi:hypothetical protein